jgi:hypothetical protein
LKPSWYISSNCAQPNTIILCLARAQDWQTDW